MHQAHTLDEAVLSYLFTGFKRLQTYRDRCAEKYMFLLFVALQKFPNKLLWEIQWLSNP